MYRLCCLFIRNDIATTETQGHSNITVLYHPPSCDATGDTQHTARGSAHAKEPKVPSRCKRGERSSNGVAQSARDPCQRWRTRRARSISARAPASGLDDGSTSLPGSDRGRSCSTQQHLRLFRMDTMDVDCHPCASKQARIVKFACREQGLGRAVDRSQRSSW